MLTLNFFNSFFIIKIFFITALLITFYTDLKFMLISRFVTLYCVPVCWFLAYFNYLPITFLESLCGTIFGYLLLWTVAKIAFYFYKVEALGQGDIDLLSFIGAFLGPIGCWFSLLIGSVTGSIFGILYAFLNRSSNFRTLRLPLGTFLVLGALCTLFFSDCIQSIIALLEI